MSRERGGIGSGSEIENMINREIRRRAVERERAEAAAANAGSNLKIEVSVHPWWMNDKDWSVGISVTDGKTISTSSSLARSREEAYRTAARTTAMKILDMGKVIP